MRIINLDINKKVVGIKYVGDNYILKENELQTDLGVIGQIMQDDGTFVFSTVLTESQPYVPSNTEIAQMISDLQADLLIAGVI